MFVAGFATSTKKSDAEQLNLANFPAVVRRFEQKKRIARIPVISVGTAFRKKQKFESALGHAVATDKRQPFLDGFFW